MHKKQQTQRNVKNLIGNDLESIRALFSEKEKELCLAVSKVDALTRQLEDLKRDRRGPLSLIQNSNNGSLPVASRELEKLRRELMVSFKYFSRIYRCAKIIL